MENRPLCSSFAPSRPSRPSPKPKSTLSHPHLNLPRSTKQLKVLFQSLQRLTPLLALQACNSIPGFSGNRGKSHCRPILVLGYEGESRGKELKAISRLRERTRKDMRAQSASVFPQKRPATALGFSESSGLAAIRVAFSVRASPVDCLRVKVRGLRAGRGKLPQAISSCERLSPRGRFRKVVSEAAASFSSEEVAGWSSVST